MTKKKNDRRALVCWYSQTGHTKRYGKLIARVFKDSGVKTDALAIGEVDPAGAVRYDIVVAGTPVFYYDVPENVSNWAASIKDLNGASVASFATFGGDGGNQHNTAVELLRRLSKKGGVPVGAATFGNMSSYAPTWSLGNERRILKFSHLPNEATYESVREFAKQILKNVEDGVEIKARKKLDINELFKYLPMIWISKLITGTHTIDKNLCTECEICVKGCPVGAIDLSRFSVNTKRCIACLGCVNNCPAGAVVMTFMGKKVYGFKEFLKLNGIRIAEP
ncbi:MAG: EFR1 family ferrodoxin [Deltaproteobacteria bacterium]|uniref:EFR1 family ferrodoxin n=1 Tax=Candidatus Zymogenus saltonus TaxID=2844893 RepID=A0A9D8PQ33_9DELT|nr:EFR1 family ferrodoxin [Candidatus Zymogenus saltonus]